MWTLELTPHNQRPHSPSPEGEGLLLLARLNRHPDAGVRRVSAGAHTLDVIAVVLVAFLAGWLGTALRRVPVERAIDFAWRELAARTHAGGVSIDDSTFLAGLALSSMEHGRTAMRAGPLKKAILETERAAAQGTLPLAHLAALQRLRIADLAAESSDPLAALAQE